MSETRRFSDADARAMHAALNDILTSAAEAMQELGVNGFGAGHDDLVYLKDTAESVLKDVAAGRAQAPADAFSLLAAYAECHEAWDRWIGRSMPWEETEAILTKHGWQTVESFGARDFLCRLRSAALVAALGYRTEVSS